mmetsp:Transcript_450/g.910  ORF Transcript_450/g.910 Transcript_450/m.910 type:complete len:122 (+) Transcript_450:368-733(+)
MTSSIYFLCYTNIHKMLNKSTFYFLFENHFNAFLFLNYVAEFMFNFCQHVAIFLNIVLCSDLIKTLQNPFEVGRSRLWKQLLFAFSIPFVTNVAIMIVSEQRCASIMYQINYEFLKVELGS